LPANRYLFFTCGKSYCFFSTSTLLLETLRYKHKPKAKGAFANMKNLLKTKRAEGFTIIEVMIVLAIAGLIMVIVFIAVPQLQRNQRDNARQNIANRLKAEIETYAGNNQGVYPFGGGTSATNYAGTACSATVTGCWDNFVTNYVANGKVKTADPSTGQDVVATGNNAATGAPQQYAAAIVTTIQNDVTKGDFYTVYGASCNGENVQASGSGNLKTRTYAVLIVLDRGNHYCVDNG
jgi:prepilin-type N-terminal cleavage/methylation domain-containing protein